MANKETTPEDLRLEYRSKFELDVWETYMRYVTRLARVLKDGQMDDILPAADTRMIAQISATLTLAATNLRINTEVADVIESKG